MFAPIQKTQFPPRKDLFIWDGQCGFCKYWILVWKSKTRGLEYQTFQEVADNFPDIPLKEFKKASRLIEKDGSVFSGPESAFRTFAYFKKPRTFWQKWYQQSKIFRQLSNQGYNFIAKNRPFLMQLTIAFWGKNPIKRKPYWLVWLLGLFGFLGALSYLLL
ncbi:DCC1-like thiol-disulfide oxidoreductase family protein [Algoriphagus sp.]|uniref:DCC1-like thiol-disulfide oxidoreductase family protein n=1 Tax=Algoriphagus sp. TaxID=1872435 RepID=UPI0026075C9E|nr:DCC1-like thiol-disulfide oxidoreductase family protein [Algoriphagus sp.]